MITDLVIKKLESRLDEVFDAHVVPESEAYPTSGSTFIRITGDYTAIELHEGSVSFDVFFSVVCSIRTRDFVKQNKYTPYYALLDLQEKCFFYLTANQSLITDLYSVSNRASIIGRFTSTKINTRVQATRPDFFASMDETREPERRMTMRQALVGNDSRRETGYLLSQSYQSPRITLPFSCLTYPEPMDTITA